MAKVIILCGKIASGKSYYAGQLKSKTDAIILSVDDLMLKLSDGCLGTRHNDVAMRCESYLYGLAEQIIHTGMDVIIDFGFWYKEERDYAKAYFRERGINAELHYVTATEEKRIRRLAERNQKLTSMAGSNNARVYIIDEELRQKLDKKFEEPSKQEYDNIIVQ